MHVFRSQSRRRQSRTHRRHRRCRHRYRCRRLYTNLTLARVSDLRGCVDPVPSRSALDTRSSGDPVSPLVPGSVVPITDSARTSSRRFPSISIEPLPWPMDIIFLYLGPILYLLSPASPSRLSTDLLAGGYVQLQRTPRQ